ncbi:uncharacterized protein LOC107266283 isoform X2 [Cephus cinctus]|uniref:Uncharacterized protein LOC107266283 isoform X2 n=1 Tax=Cephus cinctus TaxID=211228 RepID=A0AAJ7BQP0_CEPCN|nr:uncharacterized protein LOC107266283 isoform X2 [Cephus cinctus]
MSMFSSYNGRPFKFRLVNLPSDVRREIKKMILDNGGEVVNIDDRSVINFTVPNEYIPGKVMFDIAFIKDCVKWDEIRNLHEYKLGPRKEYDGCIMSIFLYGSPSCMYRHVSNSSPQINVCSACGSSNTTTMLDVSDSPGPSQNSCDTQRVITSKRLYNKDPEITFGDKAHHDPRLRKAVPSISYAVSSDVSDVQETTTFKNDKLHCKQNDKKETSTASTSDFEISDDSEAKPYLKVKDQNKNALQCSMRELHINHEGNRSPVQTNDNLTEWLIRIKRKAKTMEAPRKRNFAKWEKWQMLIFLIENDLIERAKGVDVWQHMIRQKNWDHRTKWSLNNHFRKSILPCIEQFHVPKEIEIRFVTLRNTK